MPQTHFTRLASEFASGTQPSLIFAPFLEEVARGARVAIFGDSLLALGDEVFERGARLVHAYDPDPERVRAAQARNSNRALFFAPLPESGDVGVRDGAFDVVIVPDLSFISDPRQLLAWGRRLLASSGVALIASPNPERFVSAKVGQSALGYYELFDQVSLHFRAVRMLGQVPFIAYALAEFSHEGDAEPVIDTSLAAGEKKEPDWFVAVAGERAPQIDSYVLIEVASQVGLSATVVPGTLEALAATVDDSALRQLLKDAEGERDEALSSLVERDRRLAERRDRIATLEQQLVEREQHLVIAQVRAEQLSREGEDAQARHRVELSDESDLKRENVTLHEQIETAKRDHRDQLAALSRQHDETITQRLESTVDPLQRSHAHALDSLRHEHGRQVEAQQRHDAQEVDRIRRQHTEELNRIRRQHTEELNRIRRQHTEQLADSDGRAQAELQVAVQVVVQEATRDRANAEKELERVRELAPALEKRIHLLAAELSREKGATHELPGLHEAEVAKLEAQLIERGGQVAKMAQELRNREQLARELILELEEAHELGVEGADAGAGHAVETAEHARLESELVALRVQMSQLASLAAKSEADRIAAGWRVADLSRRLALSTAPIAPSAPSTPADPDSGGGEVDATS